MYRLKAKIEGRRTGAPGGAWMVKRGVPEALRERFGGRRMFIQTTGSTDERAAKVAAERIWKGWSEEIAAARAFRIGTHRVPGGSAGGAGELALSAPGRIFES
jgi:hypothetical protein